MGRAQLTMRGLIATLTIVSLTGPVLAQSRPTADALAQSLQERYQRVLDFSADFTQTYRGGVLRTKTEERGTVLIKKPGRMKWVYSHPEKKEFVSDGRKMYAYIPADKQVIVSDVPTDDRASTSALFLAGKGNISRDFSATYVDSSVAGALALRLTPRRPEPDYEHLVLIVDPGTLQIRGLVTRDRQGGESALTFANLKENQRISDKEFVFRVPRGVKVITDDTRN